MDGDPAGEYLGDLDSDGDDDEELPLGPPPMDAMDSDTSSIIDELCFGDEVLSNPLARNDFENEQEFLCGGAELPLSPDAHEAGADVVDGLEEELPVPIVMVVKQYN